MSYVPPDETMAKANTTTGHTQVVVSFAFVHWEWIILPTIVWALGALFCLSSAWSTYHAEVQTRMNNTLPLATHFVRRNNIGAVSDLEMLVDQGMGIGIANQPHMLACANTSLREYTQRAKHIETKLGQASRN